MADAPVVHIGDNSPEHVAYKLMGDIRRVAPANTLTAQQFLALYAECLLAVKDPHGTWRGMYKTPPQP
jgi:hypothetical protein